MCILKVSDKIYVRQCKNLYRTWCKTKHPEGANLWYVKKFVSRMGIARPGCNAIKDRFMEGKIEVFSFNLILLQLSSSKYRPVVKTLKRVCLRNSMLRVLTNQEGLQRSSMNNTERMPYIKMK